VTTLIIIIFEKCTESAKNVTLGGKLRTLISINSNKKMLVAMSIILSALIADISLIKISEFVGGPISKLNVSVFIIISVAYIAGQYVILGFVKRKSEGIEAKEAVLRLDSIHRIVVIVQYVLIAILVFLILQMLLVSYYNTAVLAVAIATSYALAIGIMVVLAERFLSWFKSSRNFVVFSYCLSSAALAINAGISAVFVVIVLVTSGPEESVLRIGVNVPFIDPSSSIGTLNYAFIASSIVSFILTWIATAMLLHHYSKRLGRIKYWVIVSIPLAYFLSQFLTLSIDLFSPFFRSDPLFFGALFALIFTLSKPIGGILFGVAFWVMASSISRSSVVRDYLIISAYGFVLLFFSNQAVVLISAPYPPFGLPTILFIGLSAYLILVGIYSSAISISHDVTLRNSIRKFAINEFKLLDSIGYAHMQQEIQRKVMELTEEHKDIMMEKTGIDSSLDEDDVKQYLDHVLEEVKRKKEEGKENQDL
jgi:hypothetical protein